MALEGRLRDLALTDVLQLLALGRKTGVLHCHAPLQGRRAQIAFDAGMLVDADVVSADRVNNLAAPRRRESDRADMAAAVQDVLRWREGTFRFAPGEKPIHPSAVRLAVEPLLMQAAVRAEVWQRIEARVPHGHVIPAFVEVEPQELPLLRLTPPQWDILTRVDGQRDLVALATAMQRDLTDVAQLVYELIGAGILTLREGHAAPRKNPTPPAVAAMPTVQPLSPVATHGTPSNTPDITRSDLWVPSGTHTAVPGPLGEHDEDSLFDPIEHGVLTEDGLPLGSAPWRTTPATVDPVALTPVEPSIAGGVPTSRTAEAADVGMARAMCQRGDDLARAGDLIGAMAQWNAALRAPELLPNAERVREAVALAARLHALLFP